MVQFTENAGRFSVSAGIAGPISQAASETGEANLNLKFDMPREELEDRIKIGLSVVTQGYDHIVPLRDVKTIEQVMAFRKDVLKALIRNVQVRSEGGQVFPYKDADIAIYRIEPKGLYIGQRFVLQEKLLGIMENLEGRFASHLTNGISKMLPHVIYGRTVEDRKVMAFYVPPIVEKHDGKEVVLDGIHRNYMCRSAGTTMTSVVVSGVSVPLPFDPIGWDGVKLVDRKPPIAERYVNLNKAYFRDLTGVGIDG